jgi:hypothetical protein
MLSVGILLLEQSNNCKIEMTVMYVYENELYIHVDDKKDNEKLKIFNLERISV